MRSSPRGNGSKARGRRCGWLALLLLAAGATVATAQAAPSAAAPIPPERIVSKLVEQNRARAERLKFYCSERHYHVQYRGMGVGLAADMHVRMTYTPATGKTFQILDQTGSHLLADRVLKRLLTTERDDSLKHAAALTPQNYTFTYVAQTEENGRKQYIFSVAPKARNKLLYRGRIWIDAKDYAVTRINAEPAVNPSFWIRKTQIDEHYEKDGEFWLPQTNRSESKTRLGGSALLTIEYGTYHFAPSQCPAAAAAAAH